jgi:type II secretory pathway pseudopilin PulG
MRNKNITSQTGFTLIESLLYIALFSIIIGGALVAVYQMIESSDAVSAKNIVEMEGSFLLRKIDWALTGAWQVNDPAIIAPAISATSSQLSIYKRGYALPVLFDSNNGVIRIQKDGSSFTDLTSGNVEIQNFRFEHVDDPADEKPAEIKASFYISAKTDPDKTYHFETTKYLRK